VSQRVALARWLAARMARRIACSMMVWISLNFVVDVFN
jgi:hypothetical protein